MMLSRLNASVSTASLHCTLASPTCSQGRAVSSKSVFYWALAPMAIFYTLFAAVLLPNAAVIHPTALAEQYIKVLPARCGSWAVDGNPQDTHVHGLLCMLSASDASQLLHTHSQCTQY